jgi:ankyrin repeat and SOCS box protein 8
MSKSIKLMTQEMSEAFIQGDINSLVQLIEQGESVNAVNGSTGETLIIWASENSNNDFARFLISKGAKIEQRDYENNTPLMWAAARGNIELVDFLLESGANPNRKNHKGSNALGQALSRKLFSAIQNQPTDQYDEVIKLLIQYGAKELP